MSRLQQSLGAMASGTIVTKQLANSTKEYNRLLDEQVKDEAFRLALKRINGDLR